MSQSNDVQATMSIPRESAWARNLPLRAVRICSGAWAMTLEALAGTVRDPALALERMELRGVRMQRGLRGRLRTLEHGSGAEFNRLTGSATAPVRWVQREVYATGTSSAEEVEKQVERFLERLGLPSRERLDALAFEIESLSAQIDQALALIAAEEQRAK